MHLQIQDSKKTFECYIYEKHTGVCLVCHNGYLTVAALKTSDCAALSYKNAHVAQSPGKWETWSTWARVPADDECLSAPWQEECGEWEEGGGGRGKVEMERRGYHVKPPRGDTELLQRCRLGSHSAKGERKGSWLQMKVDFSYFYSTKCLSPPNSLFDSIKQNKTKQMNSIRSSIHLLTSCFAACICLACCSAQQPRPS